ncbi:MAG: hypothetical protein HY819_09145 [Acidobacteria bacterium]|nr:hypothetical protein [Acidobacteriota bacterium]
MRNQEISQKICPQCGSVLAPNEANCDKCPNQTLSSLSSRIWLAFGLFFFLLSIAILAATFWYVENRRLTKTNPTTNFTPLINTTDLSSNLLDLSKLSSQDLLNMVPVKVLSRYRTSLGDNLPNQISVVNQNEDQYLVLLGLERIDGDDSNKKFLASVFKLEGGTLSDVSKETLPDELDNFGNVTAEFIRKGPDFDIKLPVKMELFENCANVECEQAYYIQEVAWCGADYQIGIKNWSNDPFTVLYIFAQALDQRTLPLRERDFVANTLDPLISQGFDRGTNQKWKATNLTTDNLFQVKTLDKVSYSLSNEITSITVNLEKQANGLWQVTSLENSELAPTTTIESAPNN